MTSASPTSTSAIVPARSCATLSIGIRESADSSNTADAQGTEIILPQWPSAANSVESKVRALPLLLLPLLPLLKLVVNNFYLFGAWSNKTLSNLLSRSKD